MFPLIALLALASASETPDDAPTAVAPKSAEYMRLSQELHKLCALNAWQGVERVFLDLEATEIAPTY